MAPVWQWGAQGSSGTVPCKLYGADGRRLVRWEDPIITTLTAVNTSHASTVAHMGRSQCRSIPGGDRRKPASDQRSVTMHPSFGIEYQAPSLKWEDVMKGPSREAVLAHAFKVLHYRELFGAQGPTAGDDARHDPEEAAPSLDHAADCYAAAA